MLIHDSWGFGLLRDDCFWEGPIDSGAIPDSGGHFDIIVVGGGPGGSAAAFYAAERGLKVLLLEKRVFPETKVCGDAVGGRSLGFIKEMGIKARLEDGAHFRVLGVTFSDGENFIDIPLPEDEVEAREAGYSLPRIRTDWLLFNRAVEVVCENNGAVIQGFSVKEILYDAIKGGDDPGPDSGDGRRIIGVSGLRGGRGGDEFSFTAPLTIGAGGYNCPVARGLVKDTYGETMSVSKHMCGGFRQYWRNVEGFTTNSGNIEIHFIDNMVNGYFWIFGVGEGVCNVGIGMLVSDLNKTKKKLRALQHEIITSHPSFVERFANAEMVEGSSKGWQLPFGDPRSKKELESHQPRRAFMAGAMCIGDAASLVDGFSGEGVSHAFITGKMAALAFDKEAHSGGFPLSAGAIYQQELWKTLGPILTNSYKMQMLIRKKWLLRRFLKKAAVKPGLQDMLLEALANKEDQEIIHNKWFIAKQVIF